MSFIGFSILFIKYLDTNSTNSIQNISVETKNDEVKEDYPKNDENISKAKIEASNYVNKILSKSSNVNRIDWDETPTISGDSYYFPCEVEFDNYTKREGTIIIKEEFGVFEAYRLQLED